MIAYEIGADKDAAFQTRRWLVSCMARSIAALMLLALATPWPAISKAVPWAGEVLTKGKPMVILTRCLKFKALMGPDLDRDTWRQ